MSTSRRATLDVAALRDEAVSLARHLPDSASLLPVVEAAINGLAGSADDATAAKLHAVLLRGRKGYAAVEQLLRTNPDSSGLWLVKAIRAKELGYVRKSEEAYSQFKRLSDVAKPEDRQEARPAVLKLCLLCERQPGEFYIGLYKESLCLSCTARLISSASSAPREMLRRVWNIPATEKDPRVAMVLQQVPSFAAIGVDLRTSALTAEGWMKMGQLEIAMRMLFEVMKDVKDTDSGDIEFALSKLFDARLARAESIGALRLLLGQ